MKKLLSELGSDSWLWWTTLTKFLAFEACQGVIPLSTARLEFLLMTSGKVAIIGQ